MIFVLSSTVYECNAISHYYELYMYFITIISLVRVLVHTLVYHAVLSNSSKCDSDCEHQNILLSILRRILTYQISDQTGKSCEQIFKERCLIKIFLNGPLSLQCSHIHM